MYEHGSVGEQEGEAAMEALGRLHAAVPGFLHGAVGPENAVMVEQEVGQPPRCVILNFFGVARLDATRKEQAEEVCRGRWSWSWTSRRRRTGCRIVALSPIAGLQYP